jgi:hypothetical protein
MSANIDRALDEFLCDAGIAQRHPDGELQEAAKQNPRKPRKGVLTQGVWVGSCNSDPRHSQRTSAWTEEDVEKSSDDEVDEDDEMIWWSWDGKLVGFDDW